jgi:ABC-type transporter Mla subunit MlaD
MPVARKKNARPSSRKAPAAARKRAQTAKRDVATRRSRPTPKRPPEGPETVEPLSHALRSLRQVTDALQFVHQSFAEALLKLPHPEDFEPLLVPLREFARVSPALVEAFRGVIVTTRALIPPVSGEASGAGASPAMDKGRVDEALGHVDAALQALRKALADLPSDAAYRPVARQLRELATVSPSLMDWLKDVPKLTTPLSESVAALRRAALDLETARDLLTEDVPTPAPSEPH